MPCPHCMSPAAVSDSRQITRLVRDVYLRCTSLECGAAFKAQFAAVAMILPSAVPHPDVKLPMTPHRRRAEKITPANDDEPLARNEVQA
jgi:hypothetical protein